MTNVGKILVHLYSLTVNAAVSPARVSKGFCVRGLQLHTIMYKNYLN
jgi:hypothetical protein